MWMEVIIGTRIFIVSEERSNANKEIIENPFRKGGGDGDDDITKIVIIGRSITIYIYISIYLYRYNSPDGLICFLWLLLSWTRWIIIIIISRILIACILLLILILILPPSLPYDPNCQQHTYRSNNGYSNGSPHFKRPKDPSRNEFGEIFSFSTSYSTR